MDMNDIELKLLAGMPIKIMDCGKVYNPTLREVASVGESKYNQYLSLLLFDKGNMEESIDEKYNNFDIIFSQCYQNNKFREMYLSAIEFFFKREAHLCDVTLSDEAFFVLGENNKIHRDNFHQIQEVIRIGNHVKIEKSDERQYNPANEVTAKVIAEMLQRRKNRPKPKPTINLHSMASGMAWKSGKPEIESIFNLTMYQFYDGYRRIEKIDSIHYTLFGIYTGNVDINKISMKELKYVSIIEN